jgi:hypothetical protein
MSYLPDAGANAIIANVIEGFDREIGSSIAALWGGKRPSGFRPD